SSNASSSSGRGERFTRRTARPGALRSGESPWRRSRTSALQRKIPMHRADLHLEGRAASRAGLEGIEAQLDGVLGQLRRNVRGVRGSVVADSNGLTIASDIRSGVSPATLAAMSTLVAQSAGSVFENIGMPGPNLIIMEGPESNVVVMHIPIADVTLLTLMDKATNIGVLKIEMGKATQGIATALGFGRSHKAAMSELF